MNRWRLAAHITVPESHLDKTYHARVNILRHTVLMALRYEAFDESAERLAVKSAHELRRGDKNAWLEIVLSEGQPPDLPHPRGADAWVVRDFRHRDEARIVARYRDAVLCELDVRFANNFVATNTTTR